MSATTDAQAIAEGGEVTAAIERAARKYANLTGSGMESALRTTPHALAAALDVEEMARVLADHASWRSYGRHGHGLECSCGADLGQHSMAVSAEAVHHEHQATALRAALLGGAS